jgi:hypothetical protein
MIRSDTQWQKTKLSQRNSGDEDEKSDTVYIEKSFLFIHVSHQEGAVHNKYTILVRIQ